MARLDMAPNGLGQLASRGSRDGVDQSNVTAVATTSRTYYPKSGLLQDLTTVAADGTNRQSLSHQYRADGNLVRRFRPDMGEAFVYDDLDRLTSWSEIDQETGQAPTGGFNVSYTYDESGNLRNRVATSGVGAQSLDQKYDGSGNAGPHAITSSDLWQDDNGQPMAFGYDRVGNVTSHPASGAITYTPFNLPRSVTGAAGSTVSYLYDAFQGRVKKTVNGIETIYAGGIYERRKDATGATTHVFYVSNGQRVVAQVTATDSSTAEDIRYLYADQLGSTDATEGGDVTQVRQDPFGNKITGQAGAWDVRIAAAAAGPPGAEAVTVGFTGHEEEAELGLVNMQGRIYDPRVGRMLQADPVTAAPYASQGWNRYSYVYNNPVKYTDPTGFLTQAEAEAEAMYPNHGSDPTQSEQYFRYVKNNTSPDTGELDSFDRWNNEMADIRDAEHAAEAAAAAVAKASQGGVAQNGLNDAVRCGDGGPTCGDSNTRTPEQRSRDQRAAKFFGSTVPEGYPGAGKNVAQATRSETREYIRFWGTDQSSGKKGWAPLQVGGSNDPRPKVTTFEGIKMDGFAHTHFGGPGDTGYFLSVADRNFATTHGVPVYFLTPDWQMKVFEPGGDGTLTWLGSLK